MRTSLLLLGVALPSAAQLREMESIGFANWHG
ncbi:hypothetical protein DL239_10615 [Sedimentitalea sp. CY04]|uniref:Uncharacterized protein n=1 Tax=Parasedimentitalea denitrificans TaxID=2211118 RepID=A0ABX0W843_9RHOB|nr:hypothetical protein [Sedimentitalea sp. CY04]